MLHEHSLQLGLQGQSYCPPGTGIHGSVVACTGQTVPRALCPIWELWCSKSSPKSRGLLRDIASVPSTQGWLGNQGTLVWKVGDEGKVWQLFILLKYYFIKENNSWALCHTNTNKTKNPTKSWKFQGNSFDSSNFYSCTFIHSPNTDGTEGTLGVRCVSL